MVKINHVKKSAVCGSKEVIIYLLPSVWRLGGSIQATLSSGLPQRKREFEELNLIQQKVTNMGGALDRRSRKPVEFPSLQIVNTWLEKALNNLNLSLPEQWVELDDPRDSFRK